MVWNLNCDHFTYISFKKYLRSKDLKTSCILSHPNADSSIWVKYCDLKICHLLKILEHCYMELEVNIQERKTAPRKALSLGNGTTHCMQPPTTASQTCCLSPLFSLSLRPIMGHHQEPKTRHCYYTRPYQLPTAAKYIHHTVKDDVIWLQICQLGLQDIFCWFMISIYPIYNVNNNTKNIYM